MNASFSTHPGAPRRALRNMALVAVVGICAVAGSSAVQAEITTGRVFGHAPAGATVQVSSAEFGIDRVIPVNAKGRYQVAWLPIGVYTVTVVNNGQPLTKHPSVQIYLDSGSRVDFNCPMDGARSSRRTRPAGRTVGLVCREPRFDARHQVPDAGVRRALVASTSRPLF